MQITQEIQSSVEEMARGTEEINNAVSSVVSLTQENSRGIDGMEQEVKKFTVQGDSVKGDTPAPDDEGPEDMEVF